MNSHAHVLSHDHDEHREGFGHDLLVMQSKGMVRRGLLGLLGGLGAAAVVGCSTDVATSSDSDASSGAPSDGPGGAPHPDGGPGGGAGTEVSQEGLDDGDVPEETAGPYPGDGSNGVNVLTASGIVRSDLTASFGEASGVAEGVPMTIDLRIYDNTGGGTTPYEGAAVYLWHCDREGRYSLYSDGITEENYLRGVQVADADGAIRFTSIFPACYAGRWPHLHFEVYGSVDDATSAANKLRTSQIALAEDVCTDVYADAVGYDASLAHLQQVSLATDGIFSDGYSLQMAKVAGSVDDGYRIALDVPV